MNSSLPHIGLIGLAFILNCSGTMTNDLLSAAFLDSNYDAIELLAPADGEGAKLTTQFAWSERSRIKTYRFQMAKDLNFSDLVVDSQTQNSFYQLASSEQTIMDNELYHWRIVARDDFGNDLTSNIGTIHMLTADESGGVLYVDAGSQADIVVGNKSAPYKNIQGAIEAADLIRSFDPDIEFTILVATGEYTEKVLLKSGIHLKGQLDPLDWEVDTELTTILTSQTDKILEVEGAVEYSATTIVEGVDIQPGNIDVDTCEAIHVYSAGLTLLNSRVDLSCTRAIGFRAEASEVIIEKSEFRVQSSGTSCSGLSVEDSNLVTRDSSVYVALDNTTGGSASGVYLIDSSLELTNNVVATYNTNYFAYAITLVNPTSASIINNSISSYTSATDTSGQEHVLRLVGDGTVNTISNNIIFASDSASLGVRVVSATGSYQPEIFATNLLFDGGTALYYDGSSIVDTANDGLLNGPPNTELDAIADCGTIACSYDNISTSGSLAAVFQSEFEFSSPSTWFILGNGPADLDASGDWTEGDIGADIKETGVER